GRAVRRRHVALAASQNRADAQADARRRQTPRHAARRPRRSPGARLAHEEPLDRDRPRRQRLQPRRDVPRRLLPLGDAAFRLELPRWADLSVVSLPRRAGAMKKFLVLSSWFLVFDERRTNNQEPRTKN